MGCNTSQEQPQSTLNVNNEGENADNGDDDMKQSADGPTVPSSTTTSDKQNSAEIGNDKISSSKGGGGDMENVVNAPKGRQIDDINSQIPFINGVDINQDDDDEEEDEAKAAVKIQAAFRGHKVRTDMKKGENSVEQKSTQQKQNETPSAIKIDEDEMKDDLDIFDPNDKELCDAATKIQATFRGHLQRKLATEAKDQVDIDEITKKVAEELDIDLTDPELNKAATKIQASFRGHKTRKTPAN